MIQSRAEDRRLALLGSFTFMFFEVVQGNELGLFMHVRRASAIWKSIYRTNLESSMSSDCVETITPFTRLSIDDSRFSDLLGTSPTRFSPPSFQTTSELFFKARDSLALLSIRSHFSEGEDRFTILSLECLSHQ
jgi:hypothetical protein